MNSSLDKEKLEISTPYDLEYERILLGSIILNNNYLLQVENLVKAEFFYVSLHREIFTIIVKLTSKGMVADEVTIRNVLSGKEFANQGVDLEYIKNITKEATLKTVVDVKTYATMILDMHIRRNLIEIGERLIIESRSDLYASNASEKLSNGEKELFNLSQNFYNSSSSNSISSISKNILDVTKVLKEQAKNGPVYSGTSTGFMDMDNILGGFQKSDLIILAARPSMGKTSLAINFAMNAAKFYLNSQDEKAKSVGIFSLEMSSEQIVYRMFSMISGVNSQDMRTGNVNDDALSSIIAAHNIISDYSIYIDDTPAMTIDQIRSNARRMKSQNNIGLLVVDYLQLIRGTSKDNRVQEISEITQGLKAIARELDVPVIALSQLSRAVEQREEKRPQLSDLRDSGSIEQDADIVMFIYRAEYYHGRIEPFDKKSEEYAEWLQHKEKIANLAEVIVAKHRNGGIGTVTLHFEGARAHFSNYDSSRGS